MIRQVVPSLIATELVNVQPMQSIGNLFPPSLPTLKDLAMMNIRQRSVNVNRTALLEKLRENLVIHEAEYAEALVECKQRLLSDLHIATQKVDRTDDPANLKDFRFQFRFPTNHAQDYRDVIEMLEMSVDENINLDSESFKAYIKNEWSWSRGFADTKALYSTVGAFLS